MKRFKTGYILTKGFRPADIVGTQAVLGIHPLDSSFFIAETLEPVVGKSDLSFVPDTSFDTCPKLDVIVIGEITDEELKNTNLVDFLKKIIPNAKFVLGVSSGVLALAQTGLMKNLTATTDNKNLEKLEKYGIIASKAQGPVSPERFVTAGPSTGMIEAAYLIQKQLRGENFAKYLELNLEYDPVEQFKSPTSEDSVNETNTSDRPLKVGIILPTAIYMPDIMGAIDVFGSLKNTELYFISDEIKPSKCLIGPTIMPNSTFKDCPNLDILLIGATHPRYLYNIDLLEFIKRQDKVTKVMISVCAGSLVFGAAGLLKNKVATSNFHHTHLLKNYDSTPSGTATQRDGKYYSAGPAIGSYEIALKVVGELYGYQVAHNLEQKELEYSPKPLYGVGSPEKAGAMLKFISLAISSPSLPVYKFAGFLGVRKLAAN